MPLRFSLRQLEYFVAVADGGSIAAASERVKVSSPSISAAISQLEAEFGLQLFVRKHAHGLSLTPGGLRFRDQVDAVLREAGQLITLANDVTGQVRGPLTVGCFLTFAQIVLPQLRRRFVARYPEVAFRQVEGTQTELFEGLRRAELNMALTYDLAIPRDLRFKPLTTLPPYVLVSESHPLAEAGKLSLADLADHPMVLLDLPLSGDYFLSAFARSGVKPRIAERTRDLGMMQSLVANGFGYALANIRPTSARAPDGLRLRYIPLTGALRSLRMGLLQSAGAKPSLTVRVFVDHCVRFVTADSAPGLKLGTEGP